MNYSYIKHYLTIFEQDIAALKIYLSPYINTDKSAISCTFKETDDGMSYYLGTNILYASPLSAGAHEYVHYLTDKYTPPSWMVEGIAEYCVNYLENKGVYRMMTEYNEKNPNNEAISLYERNLAIEDELIKKILDEIFNKLPYNYNMQ